MLIDDTLWRDAGEIAYKLGRSKFRELYWSSVGNLCARRDGQRLWLYLCDEASYGYTPEETESLERVARIRYAEFFEEER